MLAALLVLTSAANALAGAIEDCNQGADHDRTIRGCSAVIGGKQKGKVSAAYYNRGLAWSGKGDYDRALADYDQAIRINPKDADTYHSRGNAKYAKGNMSGAIADYDRAIGLARKSAITYEMRGKAWFVQGDDSRAIADVDQAIRLSPGDASAYVLRGMVRLKRRELDHALTDFSEAIRFSPNDDVGYSFRGYVYQLTGDFRRALTDYDQAIRIDPKDVSSYRNRGHIHFIRADFTTAVDDFMRAADLGDDYAMLWRFFTRARLKQDGAAELGINSATLKNRNWPFPIIEFYLGKLPLEKLRAAADDSDKACELNFYLAEWHLARGEAAAAEPLLKAAVASCPKTSIEHGAAAVELERSGI